MVVSVCLPWNHGERKGGVQGWNIFFDPCLIVRTSRSLHWCLDLRRGMTFSSRCSLVNVSSEFGGEAGPVWWRNQSVWIQMFCISFQRCKHRDNEISYITLVKCNQMDLMEYFLKWKYLCLNRTWFIFTIRFQDWYDHASSECYFLSLVWSVGNEVLVSLYYCFRVGVIPSAILTKFWTLSGGLLAVELGSHCLREVAIRLTE